MRSEEGEEEMAVSDSLIKKREAKAVSKISESMDMMIVPKKDTKSVKKEGDPG